MEAFLDADAQPEYPILVRELILLDFYYRREAGQSPALADYAERFPGTSLPTAHDVADAGVADVRRLHENDQAASASTTAAPSQATAPDVGAAPSTVSNVSQSAAESRIRDTLPPELANHERYRIVRLIGEGGMGSVYQAEHRAMQRFVALKVIRRAYTGSPAAVERFLREVRAAAKLSHPNIVRAYDAESAGDSHFLVMEYIDGVSLLELVRQSGPLPVADACAYVLQAAQGLQHAHERGMVHRDVKPGNLIRCTDGAVKVLDFGLASLVEERGNALTEVDAVMGTPDYMAPEQAENPHTADIRADVYGLGCTLFHLLTGKVPYPAPTHVLKILAHREKPLPSVRKLRPDVAPELARVVKRMLAKKRENRYPTPASAAAALAPFTHEGKPGAMTGRPRRWWLPAAAVFFLFTVAATLLMVEPAPHEDSTPGPAAKFAVAELPDKPGFLRSLWPTTENRLFAPAFSWDGRLLALALSEKSNPTAIGGVRVYETATGRVVRDCIFQPRFVTDFLVMPDGKNLIVTENGKYTDAPWSIRVWDLETDTSQQLKVIEPLSGWLHHLSVSSDGKRLCIHEQLKGDTRNVVRVLDLQTGLNLHSEKPKDNPSVSYLMDDGRWLLNVHERSSRPDGRIDGSGLRLIDLEKKHWPKSIIVDSYVTDAFFLLQAGRFGGLCYRARPQGNFEAWVQTWDYVTAEPGPKPAYQITFDITASVRAQGRRLVTLQADGRMRAFDIPAGNEVFATEPHGDPITLGTSHDGRMVAINTKNGVYLYRLPDPLPADVAS